MRRRGKNPKEIRGIQQAQATTKTIQLFGKEKVTGEGIHEWAGKRALSTTGFALLIATDSMELRFVCYFDFTLQNLMTAK